MALGALLMAATTLVYANSFSGLFEGDSGLLVAQDLRVRQASPENLALIFSQQYWYPNSDSGVYRPLVTLSWLLNYSILGNGDRTAGYHAVNLALHLTNVILVWLLCIIIWDDVLPALFTAAIFALHPVNVEAVTNIAGRADLMAALGVLAGLLLHTQLGKSAGGRRPAILLGMFLAALFGIFSKENAVVLPAVMLLYDTVFRSRREAGSVISGYVAVLLALIAMFGVRHLVFSRLPLPDLPFVDNPLVGASFWTGRLTAVAVIWRYLALLLWPRNLSWDYSYNQIPMAGPADGLAALAGLLLALAALAWLHRRHAPACFFGMFFFIALAPTSNLLLIIGTIMAERLLYLPSIGFAGCMVAAAFALSRRLGGLRARYIAAGALILVIAGLGLRARLRNFDWTDGERLWSSGAETAPNSFKTHLAVTYGLSRKGLNLANIDYAISEAKRGVSIIEGLPPLQTAIPAFDTLASLYKTKGDLLLLQPQPEAGNEFYLVALDVLLRAVPLDRKYNQERMRKELARGVPPARIRFKGYAFLYVNLADVYRRQARFADAIEALRYTLRITPKDEGLYHQISDLHSVLGQPEEAIVWDWQAVLVGGTAQSQQRLVAAYASLDPKGCALVASKPNRDCPLVKTHICTASRELAELLSTSGLPDEADRQRRTGLQDGCGASSH